MAERRLARWMQLGVRQARYIGRAKTLYQLLMAATVANPTLVATMIYHLPTVYEPAPKPRTHRLLAGFRSNF